MENCDMKAKKTAQTPPAQRRRVTFRIEAGKGSDVRLAGSFNNWDPAAHPMKPENGNGTYAVRLLVPVGRHEYKFVVNGDWVCDPAGTEQLGNGHGTLNSVIEVS
jgi:1,4-alpha-glucan branching enzyme